MAHSVIERAWQTHGLDCAVLLMTNMGHRCGYVAVPEGHPWFGLGYFDAVDGRKMPRDAKGCPDFFAPTDIDHEDRIEAHIDVHGGITFSAEASGDLDRGWWFGFDCAHLDDSPAVWTEDRVASEVERMAEQLAEASA